MAVSAVKPQNNILLVTDVPVAIGSTLSVGSSYALARADHQHGGLVTSLRLAGSTTGYVGLAAPASAGSTTYTFPSLAPSSVGAFLSSDANGTMSWVTPAYSFTINNHVVGIGGSIQVTAKNPQPLVFGSGISVSRSSVLDPMAVSEFDLQNNTVSKPSYLGDKKVTISLDMRAQNTWLAQQTFSVIQTPVLQSSTGAISIRTGATPTERVSVASTGEVTVAKSITSPVIYQPNYPFKVVDISSQFTGSKTVFALRWNQSSITTLFSSLQTEDIDVAINGAQIDPYVKESAYPWISPYAWFNGYKISGGNIVLYNPPGLGDKAIIRVARTTSISRTYRYPFTASTIALGE